MMPENFLFTEKYRPKKVSELVGSFRNKILEYLKDPKAIPHFIFYSTCPGTGKSSLAKAIINELDSDALILNSSDDRKIESVREKIKEFAMTKSSKEGTRRIVFLDEADGMLKVSQDALRNIMEVYSSNVIFILTANNFNKIIEPLKSRCVCIPFAYPEKEEIKVYLEKICKAEDLDYTEDGILELIEKHYPSIRNMVVCLQDMKTEGKKVLPNSITKVDQIYEDMWKLLKEKKWFDIKKVVMEGLAEARELNTYFWQRALEEENVKILQLTCRNEKDISVGADEKVILITSLIEMVR